MLYFLLKGLIIGFSIAIVPGPMSLLTVERTLKKGLSTGLLTGLSIALADATYGMIAAAGITSMINFLSYYETSLRFVGCLYITYLG